MGAASREVCRPLRLLMSNSREYSIRVYAVFKSFAQRNEPVMTSFKTLRMLLDDIEQLDQRCRDAGLCLRTLLEPSQDKPKQSAATKPASSSRFPGVVRRSGRSGYTCSPEQAAWIRSQYPARSVSWMADAAGISINGMKSLLAKMKIAVVPRNKHGVYTTRPSESPVTATDVVLEIIKSHSANGRIARTDVRRWAKRQRLNPFQVGQVLRILQERKKITIDGDLICTP